MGDLIIGARLSDPNGNIDARESYVVFGMSSTTEMLCNGLAITVNIGNGETGTAGDDVILGTTGDDDIRSREGNDTICGLRAKAQ